MAAKSGDVRAGGAYVEVTARDQLTKTLAALKARAQAFAAGLRTVGVALAVPGAAAVLPALFRGLSRAEEVKALAEQLGASVEMAQRLKYAMDVTGMAVEDVLRRVGDPKIAALLDRAPVLNAGDLDRQITAYREWKATLAGLETELQKFAQGFLPVLQAVATFVAENKGLVVTVTLLGVAFWSAGMAVHVTTVALGVLTAGMAAARVGAVALRAALATYAGFVAAVAVAFLTLAESGDKWHQFGLILFGLAVAIKVLPPLVYAVVAAVFALKIAFVAAKAVVVAFWLAATGPVGLLVAALAGLGAAFVGFFGGQKDGLKTAASAWDGFQDQIAGTVSGVAAALGKGDIKGAWELIVASLKLTWQRFVFWVTDKWNDFKDVIVDGWRQMKGDLEYTFTTKEGITKAAMDGPAGGAAKRLAGLFGYEVPTDGEIKAAIERQGGHQGKRIQDEIDAVREEARAARRADRDAALKDLEDAVRAFEKAREAAISTTPKKPPPEPGRGPAALLTAAGEGATRGAAQRAQDYAGLVAGVRGAFRRLDRGEMQFQDQRGLRLQEQQLRLEEQQLKQLERIGDGVQKFAGPRFGP